METKAFGELSRPEQVKLFEAWLDGIPIEFRSRAKYGVWTRTPTPAWADDHYYRIAL